MKTISTLALAACLLSATAFADESPQLVPGRTFKRLIVVVLENTNYDKAIKQPFLSSLAQRGALLSNYEGVDHPSQPNYIAMISGSTNGVSSDGNVNIDARHLGDLLEEKGYDWRAYADAYPGNCFLGAGRGSYARKHVPFLSFTSVQSNPARCAKVVNSSQFDIDAAAGTLPAFSFYTPDMRNDGHDTSAPFADKWLKDRFEKLLNDPAFMNGTLFAVTFDENDDIFGGSGTNQVFTALVGPMVRSGSTVTDHLNHYSLLRMVEDNWDLGTINRGDAEAAPIAGIWIQ